MTRATTTSSTRLSTRGQVVIPAEVRAASGLLPGAQLAIVRREDGVIELRPQRRDVSWLFGACSSAVTRTDDDADIAALLIEDDERTKTP